MNNKRNGLVVFELVPEWCPYTIQDIQSKFMFDLNKSTGEVSYRCVRCNKKKHTKIAYIRRLIRKGLFTSLCIKCRGEVQRSIKEYFHILSINNWIENWLSTKGMTIKDLENMINNGKKIDIVHGKAISKGLSFPCINCGKDIKSTVSHIRRSIENNKFTGLCRLCLSYVRHGVSKKITHGYYTIQKNNVPKENRWLFPWISPVLEHRYIMALKLNRRLLKTEIVHHIDGNKLNNDISNLELWNDSHPSGQKVEEKVAWARELLNNYKNEFPIECLGIYVKKEPVKGIIFDMDGTIVNLVKFHYDCLNKALVKYGYKAINQEDHNGIFNGMTTVEKLRLLKFSELDIIKINKEKQKQTIIELQSMNLYDDSIHNVFNYLYNKKLKIAIASNSVRATVDIVIFNMKLNNFCKDIYSSQDISFSKPNPDIYLTICKKWGVKPAEVVGVEDGSYGREAVLRAGINLLAVRSPKDITIENIEKVMQI